MIEPNKLTKLDEVDRLIAQLRRDIRRFRVISMWCFVLWVGAMITLIVTVLL